jgi:hypothetical protein
VTTQLRQTQSDRLIKTEWLRAKSTAHTSEMYRREKIGDIDQYKPFTIAVKARMVCNAQTFHKPFGDIASWSYSGNSFMQPPLDLLQELARRVDAPRCAISLLYGECGVSIGRN